jgi:hypothetical protein
MNEEKKKAFEDSMASSIFNGIMRASFIIFIVFLLYAACNSWWAAYDSTDDKDNKIRSQLKAFIDYQTGCEYLSSRNGGLTSRLNKNGKHICNAQ